MHMAMARNRNNFPIAKFDKSVVNCLLFTLFFQRLRNYGKPPYFVGKSTNFRKGHGFNSYVMIRFPVSSSLKGPLNDPTLRPRGRVVGVDTMWGPLKRYICWFIKPRNTLVISTIYQSEIGVISNYKPT